MKKKLLCAVLAAGLIASVLSGCSLFSTGEAGGDKEGSSGAIEMTDKYTFEDPADLEYAKRYVIYGDENSIFVSSAKDYGLKGAYSIVYADENDQPLGEYQFMICGSEEDAQSVSQMYEAQGIALTAAEDDPVVLYTFSDKDTFSGNLIALQSVGIISETTASAYVDFYAETIGGTVQ